LGIVDPIMGVLYIAPAAPRMSAGNTPGARHDHASADGTSRRPRPAAVGNPRAGRPAFSVVTLVMTVPQAYGVWFGREIGGVSLLSWATYLLSAVLWFVYGWRKGDKTIYVACIGWIALDAAIVLGVVVRGGA
jgi:uncharacterized protein with PQ loop repeat